MLEDGDKWVMKFLSLFPQYQALTSFNAFDHAVAAEFEFHWLAVIASHLPLMVSIMYRYVRDSPEYQYIFNESRRNRIVAVNFDGRMLSNGSTQ